MEKEPLNNNETPISSQEIADVKKFHDKVEEERSPSHTAPVVVLVSLGVACIVGIVSFLVYYFYPKQKSYFAITLFFGILLGVLFVILISKKILKKKKTGLMTIPLYEAKDTPLTTLTPSITDEEGAPSYSINVEAPNNPRPYKEGSPTISPSIPNQVSNIQNVDEIVSSTKEEKTMDEVKEVKAQDEVTISVDSVSLDDESLIDRAPKHEMSLSDFELAFKNAFLEGGFQLKDASLHELASSLAFSHLFFLTKMKNEDQADFLNCLSSFFGGESLFLEAFPPTFLATDASPLLNFFLKAETNPNSYYFLGIGDVDSSFNNDFAPLINAVSLPSERNSFAGPNGEEVIPSNIIFIAYLKDDTSPFKFDDTFLRYSPFLNLRYARAEKKIHDEDSKPLSIHDFGILILHSKKTFYLSEQDWQKIDSFEELMQMKHRYVLEYKIRDWMENALSFLLGLGESENFAMDFSFGKVVLPFALSKLQAAAIQGDDGIEGFIERNLGDGETSFSNAIIKERLHFLAEEAIRLEKEKKEAAEQAALEEAKKKEEALKEEQAAQEETNKPEDINKDETNAQEEALINEQKPVDEVKDGPDSPIVETPVSSTLVSNEEKPQEEAPITPTVEPVDEVATKSTKIEPAKTIKEVKKKTPSTPKKEKRKKND